jgi:hypothetical protein
MCPEAERHHTFLVRLVDRSEFFRELCFGDVWPGGVEDVNDELFSCQKTICDEFACADSYWCAVGLKVRRVIRIDSTQSIRFPLRFRSLFPM